MVMKLKSMWGNLLSDREVRRVNELRFWLTKVLKDFNKRNSKYVAWLKVDLCSSIMCGDNTIFYRVVVRRRDKRKVSGVDILFNYKPAKERKAFAGIDGYWQNLDLDGVCELALDLTRDISFLATRLHEVFIMA
jgi:hypothetical protein